MTKRVKLQMPPRFFFFFFFNMCGSVSVSSCQEKKQRKSKPDTAGQELIHTFGNSSFNFNTPAPFDYFFFYILHCCSIFVKQRLLLAQY